MDCVIIELCHKGTILMLDEIVQTILMHLLL